MLKFSRILVALSIAFSVGPLSMAAASAQAEIPSVIGVVTDATGSPIADATVTASGPAQAVVRTDGKGAYALTGLPAGLYTLTASRTGFSPVTETDFAVFLTRQGVVNFSLNQATLSSLREIGRVTVSTRRGAFNSTPGSVAVIGSQAFAEQAQPQVAQLLDQTPGIISGRPGSNAAGSSPGGITFANIRGGLSFETATLIDGHPLAVGGFGNYVTTFLNSNMLEDVEILKGPGAAAPQINYAIGGTVNFRTREPTRKNFFSMAMGIDSRSGSNNNVLFSGTTPNGKIGYVFDYAVYGTTGPISNQPTNLPLTSGNTGGISLPTQALLINGQRVGSTNTGTAIPGIQNAPANNFALVGCCLFQSQTYTNKNELVKLRYKFSNATTFTASYLGSQTYSDQNGNHANLIYGNFTPAANAGFIPGNGNSITPGPIAVAAKWDQPANPYEINNEPIFQGEFRTTFRKDVILARFYAASINRLQYFGYNGQGSTNPAGASSLAGCQISGVYVPDQCYTTNMAVSGTFVPLGSPAGTAPTVYNGQTVPVTFGSAYFRSSEEDKLKGGSFEYDHFAGPNVYAFSFDQVNSNTYNYNFNARGIINNPSIPAGSRVRYTSILARGIFEISPKLSATLSNYFNTYDSRASSDFGTTFQSNTTSRYDGRLGVSYRPDNSTAVRFSAGSAVAPPYLSLLSFGANPLPIADRSNSFATQNVAATNLKPETAFGYDLGMDLRSKDGASVFSIDGYYSTLRNQYIRATSYQTGSFFAVPNGSPAGSPATQAVPALLTTTNVNLGSSIYTGLELSYKRDPAVGFGFAAQGALLRAYPYNVPNSFFSNSVDQNAKNTNLGIVPGINYLSGADNGIPGGYNVVQPAGSNAIPYATGYGELHFRSPNGGLISFGETYYGNNNTYNVPPFFIAHLTTKFSLPAGSSLQLSWDNLFNQNPTNFLTPYGGVGVPLVNGNTGLTTANGYGPKKFSVLYTSNIGTR